MGKKTKSLIKAVKDPQDHPISKSKTLLTNLNSYIRMLNNNFPDMPSKQYIKNIHRFIDKIKRKLKHTDQNKLVQARQKIKICTTCDRWSGSKSMIQCNICEDYYHVSCLKNVPSVELGQSWCCQHCDNIATLKKNDKNNYLQKFAKEQQCGKCQKVKKSIETFIICIKCNNKYHKNCYGKPNVVCFKCDQTIEKEIKQKQASLFDYKFQRKTQSFKKKKRQDSQIQGEFKLFGKHQISEQETQASTNPYPIFTKGFPEMTKQEIQYYKNELLYAIRAKEMIHVEQLMPINCQIYDDNEESLDFGLMHMSPSQLKVYKKYKEQPFGPYKFIYKENMGYDVVADKDLPKGMLVCQYVGDVVTFRQVIKHDSQNHNDSLFQLSAGRNADSTLYIRPQKYTNMGRFINGVNNNTGKHKINVASVRILANGKPGVFLYTTRKIKKGESLAYDYNAGGLNAYPTQGFV